MTVWFVMAAHGRPSVTRLALSQLAHLTGELAGQGIEARTVVVTDDENLDVAADMGCDVLERPNVLGLRVNDGIEYAAAEGSDWICWTGSDDWVHIDLVMAALELQGVVAGRSLAIVDLEDPRLLVLGVHSTIGAPPWLISRDALKPSGFRPVDDARTHGLDGNLAWTLFRTPWHFCDPHDLVRVDFKSSESMTSYRELKSLGRGQVLDPWVTLEERYPKELVQQACNVSLAESVVVRAAA